MPVSLQMSSQTLNLSNEWFVWPQVWAPPTPPQDENDIYIDYSLGFLYEQNPMPESLLPPVYVPKESNKRLKLDTSIGMTCHLF